MTAGRGSPVGGAAPAGHVMVNAGAGERATFLSAEGAPVLEMALEPTWTGSGETSSRGQWSRICWMTSVLASA